MSRAYQTIDFNNVKILGFLGVLSLTLVGLANAPEARGIVRSVPAAIGLPADKIFEGGSNSIVARTVGHAEGTVGADGSKTRAYFGHVDHGNGAWNVGSFSLQGAGIKSPEQADAYQLSRLKRQAKEIDRLAQAAGIKLSIEERINGVDLANQAPKAALDPGGYVARLKQARANGLTGSAAVLEARTYSYINPQTDQWEAPGLGNREDSVRHDQDRRRAAIARVLQNSTTGGFR